MSIDGEGFKSIQYQNANNSVRVTDEFMRAVEEDRDWQLTARTTGEPIGEPIPARRLHAKQSAWWKSGFPDGCANAQYDLLPFASSSTAERLRRHGRGGNALSSSAVCNVSCPGAEFISMRGLPISLALMPLL